MSNSMASRIAGIGPTWLDRRRLGFRNPLGTRDYIYRQVYSKISVSKMWDHGMSNGIAHGSVFSLEFSPEGSLLVAACEKRSILMFDPLTYKEVYAVPNAHTDCVNCVKFLDSRSFATCSDDYTVALWDARNLSQKVRSFKGHTNWVKNIEYCSRDGLLVTSGFDGNILTWEMNKYREGGMVYNKVFATNGLMRTCLTPDASKMIISTTGGYLIIIHNLDLNTLPQDLDGFKPNMYRLMQLSQTILPIASDFTHLFHGHGKRNRVEFITDFPKGDDAEIVSALQVHPDGHCAISRNVSNGEQSEWSCIHNIEERLGSDESDVSDSEDNDADGFTTVNWSGSSTSISTTPSYIIQHAHVQSDFSRSRGNEGTSTEQRDLSVSPADVWEALVAIQEARVRRERDRMALFSGQVTSRGILVRPLHSGPDSRIFVTRLVSNSGSNEGQERGLQRPENTSASVQARRNISISTTLPLRNVTITSPVSRRNVSVSTSAPRRNMSVSASVSRRSISINTDLVGLATTSARDSEPVPGSQTVIKSVLRRKIPLLQRYCSLYRRSLVGQYDRTSIRRKPIYRPRMTNIKLKRYNTATKLNTNYEMNETQRLHIELNKKFSSINFKKRAGNDKLQRPSGSRTLLKEEGRPAVKRKSPYIERRPRIRKNPSLLPSISETHISGSSGNNISDSLNFHENDEHQFRESSTFVGTLNSTQQSSRSENQLSVSARRVNESNNSSDFMENIAAEEFASDSLEVEEVHNDNGVEANEVNLSLRQNLDWLSPERNSEALREPASLDDSTVRASSVAHSQPNRERTILMGVFRAGHEDGVRGTSMRRHNIAAVTVSSSAQRPSDLPSDDFNVISRCRNSGNSNDGRSSSLKRYTSVPINKKIHQNIRRLTHYTEEPNLGRGFIKEICISPDGRVICSPFGNGIRLLSFSPTVQDLSHCYPYSAPIPLHELWLKMAHTDPVVSTKFSPFHNLLVSGCLSGKIVYYQPQL